MTTHSTKCIQTHRARRAQFTWRGALRFFFFLIVVGINFPCRAEEDAEGEMAKIVAAHKHWRESIVSVRFVWETVYDPHSKLLKDSGLDGLMGSSRDEFIWCDDGRFRLHQAVRHNDGPEILRSLRCSDGKRSYSMNYGDGPSEIDKPVSINILPAPIPGQGGGLTIVPLQGLWFSHRLYWLSDLISQGLVKFDGYADVMGERLPRVKVEYFPGSFQTIVLSPQKGYMPRLIEQGSDDRYEFLTYRLFEPNLWFPWTGSIVSTVNSSTWEMQEIQVNSHLDRLALPNSRNVRAARNGRTHARGTR